MSNEFKTGGPAFPQRTDSTLSYSGITTREYFAAKAMQGFMQGAENMHKLSTEQRKELWMIVAGYAYEVADAMLTARNQ